MPGPTVTTIQPTMSTDALFRTWGSTISTALGTAGLTQTADTGQINWTTVTRPVAINTAAGYEIWRFADTLQATAPIFLKVEYGLAAAGGLTMPQVWLTVGTGSDGAGNLTSVAGSASSVSARNSCASTSASDTSYPAATQPMYVNGDGSTCLVACFPNTTGTNYGFGFLVERFRNWDGTVNSDGFVVCWFGSGNTGGSFGKSQMVFFGTSLTQPNASATHIPGVNTAAGGSGGNTVPTGVIGNTLYPSPVLPSYGGKVQGPCAMALLVMKDDCAAANQFTCTHYGVSHTWAAMGAGSASAGFTVVGGTSGNNKFSLLVRID